MMMDGDEDDDIPDSLKSMFADAEKMLEEETEDIRRVASRDEFADAEPPMLAEETPMEDDEDYVPEGFKGFMQEAEQAFQHEVSELGIAGGEHQQPRSVPQLLGPNNNINNGHNTLASSMQHRQEDRRQDQRLQEFQEDDDDDGIFYQILGKESDSQLRSELIKGLDHQQQQMLQHKSSRPDFISETSSTQHQKQQHDMYYHADNAFASPSMSDITSPTVMNPTFDMTDSQIKRVATEGMTPARNANVKMNLQHNLDQQAVTPLPKTSSAKQGNSRHHRDSAANHNVEQNQDHLHNYDPLELHRQRMEQRFDEGEEINGSTNPPATEITTSNSSSKPQQPQNTANVKGERQQQQQSKQPANAKIQSASSRGVVRKPQPVPAAQQPKPAKRTASTKQVSSRLFQGTTASQAKRSPRKNSTSPTVSNRLLKGTASSRAKSNTSPSRRTTQPSPPQPPPPPAPPSAKNGVSITAIPQQKQETPPIQEPIVETQPAAASKDAELRKALALWSSPSKVPANTPDSAANRRPIPVDDPNSAKKTYPKERAPQRLANYDPFEGGVDGPDPPERQARDEARADPPSVHQTVSKVKSSSSSSSKNPIIAPELPQAPSVDEIDIAQKSTTGSSMTLSQQAFVKRQNSASVRSSSRQSSSSRQQRGTVRLTNTKASSQQQQQRRVAIQDRPRQRQQSPIAIRTAPSALSMASTMVSVTQSQMQQGSTTNQKSSERQSVVHTAPAPSHDLTNYEGQWILPGDSTMISDAGSQHHQVGVGGATVTSSAYDASVSQQASSQPMESSGSSARASSESNTVTTASGIQQFSMEPQTAKPHHPQVQRQEEQQIHHQSGVSIARDLEAGTVMIEQQLSGISISRQSVATEQQLSTPEQQTTTQINHELQAVPSTTSEDAIHQQRDQSARSISSSSTAAVRNGGLTVSVGGRTNSKASVSSRLYENRTASSRNHLRRPQPDQQPHHSHVAGTHAGPAPASHRTTTKASTKLAVSSRLLRGTASSRGKYGQPSSSSSVTSEDRITGHRASSPQSTVSNRLLRGTASSHAKDRHTPSSEVSTKSRDSRSTSPRSMTVAVSNSRRSRAKTGDAHKTGTVTSSNESTIQTAPPPVSIVGILSPTSVESNQAVRGAKASDISSVGQGAAGTKMSDADAESTITSQTHQSVPSRILVGTISSTRKSKNLEDVSMQAHHPQQDEPEERDDTQNNAETRDAATKERVRSRIELQKKRRDEENRRIRERIAKRQVDQVAKKKRMKEALDRAKQKRESMERQEKERIEKLKAKIKQKERKASPKKMRIGENKSIVLGFKAPPIKPTPTIPKMPSFATERRLGPPKERKRHGTRDDDDLSLARSTDLMRKGFREGYPPSPSGHKVLTIPHGPTFAKSVRQGARNTSTAPSTTGSKDEPTFQSMLRTSAGTGSPNRPFKLTVPEAPKFNELHHRELPRSTAEREEAIMEKLNSKPFKARPFRMHETGPAALPTIPKRRLTTPEPFQLRTDNLSHHSRTMGDDDKDENFHFRARPMPKFSGGNQQIANRTPVSEKRQLTTPEPFAFRTEIRLSEKKTPVDRPIPRFRARPMPDFSKINSGNASTQSGSQRSGAGGPEDGQRRLTMPEPFKFNSSTRTSRTSVESSTEIAKEFRARPAPVFSPPSIPIRHMEPEKTRPSPGFAETAGDKSEEAKQFKARPLPDLTSPPSIVVRENNLVKLRRSPSRPSSPRRASSSHSERRGSPTRFRAKPAPPASPPSIAVRQRSRDRRESPGVTSKSTLPSPPSREGSPQSTALSRRSVSGSHSIQSARIVSAQSAQSAKDIQNTQSSNGKSGAHSSRRKLNIPNPEPQRVTLDPDGEKRRTPVLVPDPTGSSPDRASNRMGRTVKTSGASEMILSHRSKNSTISSLSKASSKSSTVSSVKVKTQTTSSRRSTSVLAASSASGTSAAPTRKSRSMGSARSKPAAKQPAPVAASNASTVEHLHTEPAYKGVGSQASATQTSGTEMSAAAGLNPGMFCGVEMGFPGADFFKAANFGAKVLPLSGAPERTTNGTQQFVNPVKQHSDFLRDQQAHALSAGASKRVLPQTQRPKRGQADAANLLSTSETNQTSKSGGPILKVTKELLQSASEASKEGPIITVDPHRAAELQRQQEEARIRAETIRMANDLERAADDEISFGTPARRMTHGSEHNSTNNNSGSNHNSAELPLNEVLSFWNKG